MAEKSFVALGERGLLVVAGEDRRVFLQGLISNDVEKVAASRAIHAALLTAQGKYLHDFFVAALGETLILDGEAARLGDLQRRLGLYRLRTKVTLAPAAGDLGVFAAFGGEALAALGLPDQPGAAAPFGGGVAFVDPRLVALGARLVMAKDAGAAALRALGFAEAEFATYDRLRLEHGVPDGSRDLTVEKAILLESGFEELNGVDWQKGCYIGQELTARTKYRGLIKKRLMAVRVDGALPPPGTPVMLGEQEAGEMRSGRDGIALALLRLDAVAAASAGQPLTSGAARLTPIKPDWARF
jgi:folate-binding protein YgfZ